MNKRFCGEVYIETESLRENGIYHPIKIEYYKMENENSTKYGIEVVKKEYKEDITNVEVNKMYEITDSEEKIDEILSLFKTSKVTPVIANDILEDLLHE